MSAPSNASRNVSTLRRILAALGPGVITGAADDDPSGIATYSITGAQFGTRFLWTAPVLWPLMASAQMMCARIGLVTGQGLAGALRQKYPRLIYPEHERALDIDRERGIRNQYPGGGGFMFNSRWRAAWEALSGNVPLTV